jgi:basic membrane lipoprotein Med (substrate-binding protein (PBP1-ABC) superfamily)
MYDNDKDLAFDEARKQGKSCYSGNVAKGISGNLPSLSGLLRNEDIVSEVMLGTFEIPLKKVKGTLYPSRSTTFAANFLPIASSTSEFGEKWKTLYNAHIAEGIRDPIKVCEYLNWYYVIEGNKRVSVLKFVGAVTVRAEVNRILPRFDENNRAIRTYYEFLAFQKKTGLSGIWFSNEEGFSELLKLLENYKPELKSEPDKYQHFRRFIYGRFREIYHSVGGGKLRITTGDALLSYLQVYGIPQQITDRYKGRIKRFLSELESMSEKAEVSFQTEPLQEVRRNVFSALTTLVTPRKNLKVGFVYALDRDTSGWTFAHDLGRQHIQLLLKEQIETTVVENVPETGEAYDHFKKLAAEGHDIIFATRPTFIKPALKAALEFPDVRFLTCSAVHSFKNVVTYSGRSYEPRFLIGLIAGSLTKTNILGYMGEYPIPEVVAGVNAFTLGARMVNPHVRVKVAWSYRWDKDGRIRNPEVELQETGADFISHDGLPIPGKVKKYGLYAPRFDDTDHRDDDVHYAMSIWHWGVFYEKLVRAVLSGSWKVVVDSLNADSDLLHFWWGMDSGIVDIFYSLTHLPRETQMLVDFMRKMIIRNEFQVFRGPIYDQSGKLRISEDEIATHDNIIAMDWFVDGVEGDIPSLDRLTTTDDPLTDLLGIRR